MTSEPKEKTLESPLDCKEIQPVHPKGNQSWIFIGRTDAEVETPILWTPNVKNWLNGKDPDVGQDWSQEKGQQRMRRLDGIINSMDIIWVSSGSWWCTGNPGMLRFMGSQRVGHGWVTELNWIVFIEKIHMYVDLHGSSKSVFFKGQLYICTYIYKYICLCMLVCKWNESQH